MLFLGAHTLTTQRDLRARLIASMGEGGYKIAYSLVSAAGLALIVWGFAHYRATGWIDVWTPPKALKHLKVALMLPAVILVVASYIRGRIYSDAETPDAGRREAVGVRRICSPMAISARSSCSARFWPGQCSTAFR